MQIAPPFSSFWQGEIDKTTLARPNSTDVWTAVFAFQKIIIGHALIVGVITLILWREFGTCVCVLRVFGWRLIFHTGINDGYDFDALLPKPAHHLSRVRETFGVPGK